MSTHQHAHKPVPEPPELEPQACQALPLPTCQRGQVPVWGPQAASRHVWPCSCCPCPPSPALRGQEVPSPESCREGLSDGGTDGQASTSPGREQCTRTRLFPHRPPPCAHACLSLHAHACVHLGALTQTCAQPLDPLPGASGGCGQTPDGASSCRVPGTGPALDPFPREEVPPKTRGVCLHV